MLDLTTVICTRISNDSHVTALKRCVESIKTFSGLDETNPIVIVDSDSPDKRYMNEFLDEKNIHIENIQNKNYEAGAWFHAYKTYKSARYLFIHDNSYLTDDITHLKSYKLSIFYAMSGWAVATGEEIEWAHRAFTNTEWKKPPHQFTALGGSMFYSQRTVLDDLIPKGLFNTLPTNKSESQAFERYIGAVLAAGGYESEILNTPRLPLLKEGFGRQ